jgi:hypothetical protein
MGQQNEVWDSSFSRGRFADSNVGFYQIAQDGFRALKHFSAPILSPSPSDDRQPEQKFLRFSVSVGTFVWVTLGGKFGRVQKYDRH